MEDINQHAQEQTDGTADEWQEALGAEAEPADWSVLEADTAEDATENVDDAITQEAPGQQPHSGYMESPGLTESNAARNAWIGRLADKYSAW